MEFLLIPLFGMIPLAIVFLVISINRRKMSTEQSNPYEVFRQDIPMQTAASVRPVADAHRAQQRIVNPNIPNQPEESKQKEEKPDPAIKHSEIKQQKPILSFTGDEAVKGILYAEILGKPKALH